MSKKLLTLLALLTSSVLLLIFNNNNLQIKATQSTDKAMHAAEIRALQGSKESSRLLLSHYEECWARNINLRNSTEALCMKSSSYWAKIDAENGSTYGMSILSNSLMSSGNCSDILRSIHWAQKLSDKGSPYHLISARERLREVCHIEYTPQ